MSRSIWKPPLTYTSSYGKQILPNQDHKKIKIWSRFLMISPNDVGKQFLIHNGKNWISIPVVDEMVGHKFGEFCSTRKRVIHRFERHRVTKSGSG